MGSRRYKRSVLSRGSTVRGSAADAAVIQLKMVLLRCLLRNKLTCVYHLHVIAGSHERLRAGCHAPRKRKRDRARLWIAIQARIATRVSYSFQTQDASQAKRASQPKHTGPCAQSALKALKSHHCSTASKASKSCASTERMTTSDRGKRKTAHACNNDGPTAETRRLN